MFPAMEQQAQAPQKRQISILVTLIVAVATPATMALSYYALTGDPTFRPLALTVERLMASGQVLENTDVQGFITSDGTREGREIAARLATKLERAFFGKGLGAQIGLLSTATSGVSQIFLRAEGKTFGPFSAHDATEAVLFVSESVKVKRRLP